MTFRRFLTGPALKACVGLAFAGGMMVSTASANTIYLVGLCGTFSNPAPNSALTGSWTCPTAAGLGLGSNIIVGEFVSYDSDYSSGFNPTVSTQTAFGVSSTTPFALTSDTLVSTGASLSTPATCGAGGNPNALTTVPGPSGPVVLLAGCYDTASPTFGNAVIINYTNMATTGSALQATGYAQIVYEYSNGIPEPGTMALIGGGLIAVSLVRRRRVKSDPKQ